MQPELQRRLPQIRPLPQHSTIETSLQSQQAYDNLLQDWKMRQHQSYSIKQNKCRYTYDPNIIDYTTYTKPVSQQRNQIFTKYCQQICKYLNSKYIIQEIIQPLRKYKIVDQQCIWDLEMLYLLAFRAWTQINVVLNCFHARKVREGGRVSRGEGVGLDNNGVNLRRTITSYNKIEYTFENYDNSLLKYLLQPMIKLSIKADKLFDSLHKQLTLKQSFLKNKINAFFFNIFNHKAKLTQDTYLCGIEGLDFQREQQINYMCQKYIDVYVLKMEKAGAGYVNMMCKLKILKKLLMTKLDNMEGYDDYEKVKNQLIQHCMAENKQESKQESKQEAKQQQNEH